MTTPSSRLRPRLIIGVLTWLVTTSPGAPNSLLRLDVDATDAPRRILHARLSLPASPGALTLLYPRWIPGEHGPTGPIADLVGLKLSAAGQPVAWQRDAEDMFAFHVTVPADATALEIAYDFLLPPNVPGFSSGGSSSATLLVLNWNQVVLYPQGANAADLQYAVTLRLPKEWNFGTALPTVQTSAGTIEFAPASLETLVDSPVIAGKHFRTLDLSPGAQPSHQLHLVADSAAALNMAPENAVHFERLVAESGALFGARHYRSYHFLLTLSEHVAHFGLEHHESSDNRQPENYLTDPQALRRGAELLPHEMVHSWNGKYRRPAGLTTPHYHRPLQGELLWVYEGLTDYLGKVLTVRCGLWSDANFREAIALEAAVLDYQKGRTWRPLVDTTVAAQILYGARSQGVGRRRQVDFYPEGDLIWLEADVLIRQKTQGRRSLDDFCREFCGGSSGPPAVVPYTREDVLAGLNEIAPHDWRQFFQSRVYAVNPRAPLGGIEGSGWRLAFTHAVPEMLKAMEAAHKVIDLSFSLGLTLKTDGAILDVIPGSPADQAGLGPDMKLVAVNRRRWTPEILRAAIQAGQTNTAPLELLVENADYFQTCPVNYHAGEKYPVLERDPTQPDLLAEILKPRTPATASPKNP